MDVRCKKAKWLLLIAEILNLQLTDSDTKHIQQVNEDKLCWCSLSIIAGTSMILSIVSWKK